MSTRALLFDEIVFRIGDSIFDDDFVVKWGRFIILNRSKQISTITFLTDSSFCIDNSNVIYFFSLWTTPVHICKCIQVGHKFGVFFFVYQKFEIIKFNCTSNGLGLFTPVLISKLDIHPVFLMQFQIKFYTNGLKSLWIRFLFKKIRIIWKLSFKTWLWWNMTALSIVFLGGDIDSKTYKIHVLFQ